MQFKEALKAAGLANPGRTTWWGKAKDGSAVFTIWSHEVHQVEGRLFAWWDHSGPRAKDGELKPRRKGQARTFIAQAGKNLGKRCRVVIVYPKTAHGNAGVASAEYPHPDMAWVVFRHADTEALQFIAELLPAAAGSG